MTVRRERIRLRAISKASFERNRTGFRILAESRYGIRSSVVEARGSHVVRRHESPGSRSIWDEIS